MIKRLSDLCKELDDFEYGKVPMDEEAYKLVKGQVKKAGEKANSEGGFKRMREVALEAERAYSNAANCLNHTWDGIGDWES